MVKRISKRSLKEYYLDIEQELQARKSFPNTSQNKKRIIQIEAEKKALRELMEREQ
jgi:hypothetical protein